MHEQLQKKIAMLGKRWIMHSDYRRRDNPAHAYKAGAWFLRKRNYKKALEIRYKGDNCG